MPPKKIRDYNENYFDIPTVENCYWAGFIATDGTIGVEGFGRLCLSFGVTDLVAVEGLVSALSANRSKIKTQTVEQRQKYISHIRDRRGRPRQVISKKDLYYVNFISNNLCGKLWSNFNITIQKTYTLKPPKIEDIELIKSFLIGVIDGVGCICNTDKTPLSISITGASLPFITWCNKQLALIGDVNEGKVYIGDNTPYVSECYVLRYSGRKAKKILEVLNTVPVPKLERKWSKIYAKTN